MKRFKIPETGDNVILKSKKTADYKEVKIVEVEDDFIDLQTQLMEKHHERLT